MCPHFRFGPFSALVFSRRAAFLAASTSVAILLGSLGCMGLELSGQNGTMSHEGTVSLPPNSTVEVVYPAPFASTPTLTIYAWHSDWKIVQQTEKSFKLFNKNLSKSRSVEWKARGLRVVQPPPKAQTRVIGTPLTTPGLPTNEGPPQMQVPEIPRTDGVPPPATIGQPR
jgi:hypothetical protein